MSESIGNRNKLADLEVEFKSGEASKQNVEEVLKKLLDFSVEDVEEFLPLLCKYTDRLTDCASINTDKICQKMLFESQTRTGRRCAVACLKQIKNCQVWADFFVLIEAMEEPQFHIIRPVLSRMDSLVKKGKEGKIEFVWIIIVIMRALKHTNGWIRSWAIEKSIEISPELLAENYEFIPNYIIPNINNNDIFWRLLEKQSIEVFLNKFGMTIQQILDNLKKDELRKIKFLELLFQQFANLSCPTTIFFVSTFLRNLMREELLNESNVAMLRRAIIRAKYIPHKSMRICTIRNMIEFHLKMCRISWPVLEEIAHEIGFIAEESTELMIEELFKNIEELVKNSGFLMKEGIDEDYFVEKYANNEDNKNMIEISRIWWISFTNQNERRMTIGKQISIKIVDFLSLNNAEKSKEFECLLYLKLVKPINVEIDVFEIASHLFGEYILRCVISSKGLKNDFYTLKHLYIPIFLKNCEKMLAGSALALLQILSENLSCESHTLILTFFNSIVHKLPENQGKLVIDYLEGNQTIELKRQKKSIEEIETKDFNKIVARLHSMRLNLLNSFIDEKSVEIDKILEDCVEQLDIASSFAIKQAICRILARFVDKTTNIELRRNCVRATYNIVMEEKKSLNNLPSLECFAEIALKADGIDEELNKEIIELFEKQIGIANQSVQVALIIIDCLERNSKKIGYNWAKLISKLAMFGPVPKKESKVLTFSYMKMFNEEQNIENDPIERLDEIVQRARLKAVLLAINLAENNENWGMKIIEEIVKMTKLMDQSSSRSFGLSMAHRQKTRAVELLHLLIAEIKHGKMIEEIFEYGISCIIDPCQQYSIKLIIEWMLALICLRFESFFQKLICTEFEENLAKTRIGSISSWINILMLISRSDEKLATKCLKRIIPWTSAQNFPIRCTAIAAGRLLFDLLDENDQKKYEIVKSVVMFSAEPAGNSKRVIENLCGDFYFARLDVKKHFDLQTILSVISKKTGMPSEETIPLHLILELNTTKRVKSQNEDVDFLDAPSDVYSALIKNASSAPSMRNGSEEDDEDEGSETEIWELDNDEKNEQQLGFQRKIVKDEHKKKDESTSLIVVASLVDKAANLGGICRTCEIFGVDELVIADTLLASDANFQALSMSSEKWQKIVAVRPQNLLIYLEEMKRNGYTIIAVEQTTNSVMMHDFIFPKKSVIVMGDEKEGVPVELLRAVDRTVEIKQLGHTRSLNVHVTAALMISKFAEQVRFLKIHSS